MQLNIRHYVPSIRILLFEKKSFLVDVLTVLVSVIPMPPEEDRALVA